MRYTEAWPFMEAAVQQPQYDGRDRLPIKPKGAALASPVLGSPHVIPARGPTGIGSSPSLHAPARATTANALPVRLSRLWLVISTGARLRFYPIAAWGKSGELELGIWIGW